MRVLIDHCLDWRLKRALPEPDVMAVYEMGWEAAKNGRLLTLAEAQFDVLLTVDKGIEYQQNLTGRAVAIITLRADSNRLQGTLPLMPLVAALLLTAQAGHCAPPAFLCLNLAYSPALRISGTAPELPAYV